MDVISRQSLIQRLGSEEMQFVEVLGPEQFRDFHLPAAINVPLDEHFDDRIQQAIPDRSLPLVVYGRDADDTTSAQAARRLDELGYRHVYDYSAGKRDWKSADLPMET